MGLCVYILIVYIVVKTEQRALSVGTTVRLDHMGDGYCKTFKLADSQRKTGLLYVALNVQVFGRYSTLLFI